MEEDFFDQDLINRFEDMLNHNQMYYFDVEEFEEIISYYVDLLDFDYGLRALNLAKIQHPLSIEIKLKEIEVLLSLEDLQKAYDLIEQLKPYQETHVELFILQAKYWSLMEDSSSCIFYYKEALKKDIKEDQEIYLEIYVGLGDEYLSLRESAKALYFFQKALKIDPYDEYVFYSCVGCFEVVFLHGECINFLNQFLEENPYHQRAWYELALKHLVFSNYSKALEALDYAILIKNDFLEAYYQKAKLFKKLTQYEKAFDVYKEILSFDKGPEVYYEAGICAKEAKNFYKALDFFEEALSKKTITKDEVYFQMALVYEKLQNHKKALFYLSKALKGDDQNLLYWKKNIDLAKKISLDEEVLISYEKALSLDESDYEIWKGYVEFLITKKEYKKTISTLENIDWFEDKPQLYYYSAYCYFFCNKEKKAFCQLTKALKKAPDFLAKMDDKYVELFGKIIHKKKPFLLPLKKTN